MAVITRGGRIIIRSSLHLSFVSRTLKRTSIFCRDFSVRSRYADPAHCYVHDNIVKSDKHKPSPCYWMPQAIRVPDLYFGLNRFQIWDGDGLHRLVFLYKITGDEFKNEHELFNHYVQILAKAIGSKEEEAKRRIYLVSCGRTFGFGAEIDEELRKKLKEDENVSQIFYDPHYSKRKKDPKVQSRVRFTPINLNHCLDSIFSYHHLSEPNKKWNVDHWLVNIAQPVNGFVNPDQVIESYIGIMAKVLGSEEAAIKSIYSVWLKFPFGFGAEFDRKTKTKLIGGCPDIHTIVPDFSFDIKAKGGDGRQALHIFPSSCGLRISCCRLDKEYGSEDWFISMEEYVGQHINSGSRFMRFFPNLSDPYLTNNDTRSACKHWFIVMEKPCGEAYSFQRRIDNCIQSLSTFLGGSVRRKIYRIKCVSEHIGFGINIAKRTSDGLRDMRGVRMVLPDYSIRKSKKVVRLTTPYLRKDLLCDMFTYYQLSICRTRKFYDHWLIHIKEPNGGFRTEPQIINLCILMLARVVGSVEDAKKKIYIVWCKTPYGFGAKIDMKTFKLLKGLPDVLAVLPDHTSPVIDRFRGVLVISPPSSRPPVQKSLFYTGLGQAPSQNWSDTNE